VLGLILAAGAGRRLGPLTREHPKTLLEIDGDRTILDLALANLAAVGLREAVVVTGFAAERIDELVPELERRHGLDIRCIFNPKAEEWNNAYSLWCAREALADGALLINGDTVHPAAVEQRLLAADGADLVIAVDDAKVLGDEEMKVRLSDDGTLTAIAKQMAPAAASGEYIGLARIDCAAADALAAALEATWRRDPSLYYEDGFQELVDRGGRIAIASVGGLEWAEVDDDVDLARAREVACRC
jgi:choline kinase